MSTIIVVAVHLVLLSLLVVYVVLRPNQRFERFLVAIVGAFTGSLVGRIVADPSGIGHLLFVTGGACLLSLLDWTRRSTRLAARRQ